MSATACDKSALAPREHQGPRSVAPGHTPEGHAMDQDRNVGKRFSRERFRLTGAGTIGAGILIVLVIGWVVYTTGFLRA